jgi:hypothetical protein
VGEVVNQESLAKVQQFVSAAIETLRTEIIAVKRRTVVLTDGVQHEFKMGAKGFQMHLDRHHTDDRAYLDEQFRETRALIQLSYGQIQERVERLEQRVRTIEQHLGLPA